MLDSDPSDVAPLFRLFRPHTGDHFYTTDLPERDNAVSQLGYRPEGIACYAYLSQQSGTTPFFRLVKARLMAKTAFRPARDGFAFANSWSFDQFEKDKINELIHAAAVPVMLALVPLLVPAVGIIDAIGALFGIPPGTIETAAAAALLSGKLDPIIDSFLPETYGLCGGMAYAALDYFNLNWVVNRGYADPPQRTSMEGTVLRDYIWSRLIDGFIAGNAQTTVEWMTLLHLIPESSGGGARELLKRSIVQWESLKNHIDAGEAWPLGLIGTTVNPSNNHQVLAYGYADNGDNTGSIWIYDDNVPDTEVVIDLNFNGPELQAVEGASSSEDRGPLKGFFCESYTLKVPPVALGLSRGISALLAGTTGNDSSLSYEATNFGIGPTQALQLYVRAVDPSGQPVEITSTQEDKAGPVPIESAVLRSGHSSGAVVSRQLDIGFTASVPGTWTFYPIAYLPTIVNEPVFRTIPGVGQAGQPDHVAVDFGALIQ
ncbi:hypothetical protein WL77_32385 [Burkholderia ubonensis]|nr:hypothetical protein WL77_32385 [Burkholderia ubonensis]KWE77768.1 hypothetical protein WL79_06685 [Burkholderia ubonensis]